MGYAFPQFTGPQRRLLRIVADSGDVGVSARKAAELMWPDSSSWQHPTRRGRRRAVVFGQGAQLRAGEMLSRLHDAGMVSRGGAGWRSTPACHEYLSAGRLL